MGWFSKKKQELATKSASFIFGTNALRAMGNDFGAYATEGYAMNPVVRSCVDKIALSLSSVDIKAYVLDKNGKLIDKPNHPILQLLRNPNPAMSGEDLLAEFVRHYLISGNAYLYGSGIDSNVKKPPNELYVYSPANMSIIEGKTIFPEAYKYRNKNNDIVYPVNQLTGLSAILHKKTYNPVNKNYGLSLMSSSAFAVDIINEGARWNLRLLQNEGRPSGALVIKGSDGNPSTLSDAQYQKLREELTQQFSGSNNAGRPLLLEGGMEWQEMSMNAKDMDFEKNINNAKRDIALSYGVPPVLIGIQGDSTYANMAEARLALWTDTVLPLLQSMLSSINTWLAPLYGDGVILWYDEDTIPALEPLRSMKAQRIEASETMTVNEKRRAMGLDDIEGGDTLFIDTGKVPLALAGEVNLMQP